jgi:hypothetical protein
LLRIACARGDAASCQTIAVQLALQADSAGCAYADMTWCQTIAGWRGSPDVVWPRGGAELGSAYSARAGKLGSAIGCALAATPDRARRLRRALTPAAQDAHEQLERACRAGEADACAFGIALTPDLEVGDALGRQEGAIVRRECDAGRAASCAYLMELSDRGHISEMYGLTGPGAPSRLQLAIRACALGHVPTCLELAGVDRLSVELQQALQDPEVVRLVAAKEAACEAGSVGACAWRAGTVFRTRDAHEHWQARAFAAASAICDSRRHQRCDDAMSELVNFERPSGFALTDTGLTDEACARGSLLACVIVVASSYGRERDHRNARAFRNAEAIGLRGCASDPVRCAAQARLVLSSTRFRTDLVGPGEDLARKLFRAACTARAPLACLEALELLPEAEHGRWRELYRGFERETCGVLRRACGGAQCDPACLALDGPAPGSSREHPRARSSQADDAS